MKYKFWLYGLTLLDLACVSAPVGNTWMTDDPKEWPQIALVNEVWYQGGERYVHPSFAYAGTGFLIDYGQDTFAATTKHTLWVAKPKAMMTVDPNTYLEKWVMRPKGATAESVLIDSLINTDTDELLSGASSSIVQRDWIVFSTRRIAPHIQPLKPTFRPIRIGEQVYFLGYPYQADSLIVQEGRVLSARGNRIVFSKTSSDIALGGASGSPVIDSAGYLVGILGGFSFNPENGEDALYAISTQYLKKVLKGESGINKPLIPIQAKLESTLEEKGIEEAISQTRQLLETDSSYFQYHISPEGINQVAENLLENERPEDAIAILKMNLDYHYFFAPSHLLLARGHYALKDAKQAEKTLGTALEIWPENKEIQRMVNTPPME